MHEIGIRQGRLSPPAAGAATEFPWRSWKGEFALARTCGFDSVEWLFAADEYDRNPIWTSAGQHEILDLIGGTGVPVASLCADYFIVHPFVRVTADERRESIAVLDGLIVASARVGIRTLVVPALETAEVRTAAEMAELRESLVEPLAMAEARGVRLAIESDLPAPDVRALVEGRRHAALGVCYDIGNATARGYDVEADVSTLAPFLSVVHVKDRLRNGPSVRLGQGDADFEVFFRVAAELGYSGSLILETPAGDEPAGAAAAHLRFLRERAVRAGSSR